MDEQTVARYWDENASIWTKGVRAGHDIYREHVNNPAFFKLLPNLKGKSVLDIGCGEGYNTRLFAELGAEVTGVDISSDMIDAAREHEQQCNKGISYIVTSGADLSMFDDYSFDVVLSTMAIMDMPDYTSCIREVSRVIKPNGCFQFSITHPCTFTRKFEWIGSDEDPRDSLRVGQYFGPDKEGVEENVVSEWHFTGLSEEARKTTPKFKIPVFFRTLSEYFNTLINQGFIVTKLHEPCATKSAIKEKPHIADTRVVPYFLIFQCKKGD